MESFWQDLRYAARKLTRGPGFALVAILTLALGIGANTAIYSVVHGVLLRPLPYEDPDDLVVVWERNFPRDRRRNVVAAVNFLAWRERNTVFQGMAALASVGATLTGEELEPQRIRAGAVTPGFFRVLRADVDLGRTLLPQDGLPGAEDVVILSHRFWVTRLGADPAALGRSVTLNGDPYTIVGVLPPGFRAPRFETASVPEVWAPLALDPAGTEYNGRSLHVLARLKPDVGLEAARAEMAAIARRLEEQHEYNAGWGVNLVPLHEQMVGAVRPALLVLLGAVGLVLLIACANVANLQLARGTARRREFAVRTALGADRFRLARQLLTESVLLALLGGGLGVLLAIWGVDMLQALGPGDIPRLQGVGISGGVLLFTLGISLLAGLLFGLAPALAGMRTGARVPLIRWSGRGSESGGKRARDGLVVAEIALAVVLLVGAGLAARSFWELRSVDPGFEPKNLLTVRIALSGSDYPEQAERIAFYGALIERVEALPGVRSASATIARPLGGGLAPATSFFVTDRPRPPRQDWPVADIRPVLPGYFRTMDIPLLQGRDFGGEDRAGAVPVVVINRTMARTHWPDGDPVGERVTVSLGELRTAEIVGVVGDVRHANLAATPRAKIYYPYAQLAAFGFMDLVVRTPSDPESLVTGLRRAVQALDPSLPVYDVTTMSRLVSHSVAEQRFNMLLLGLFAAVALTLACVGIYGVVSYSVARRTHEIGIRMALGARETSVLWLVVARGMALALTGVGMGVAMALGLTRLMTGLLYGVAATDPTTFAGVALLLLLVAGSACYLPAWRAARMDPAAALRYE